MKKSFIYVLFAAFLFGTMEVALKIAGVSFNALQMTFLRFFIGGLCLLPFAIHDLKKRRCIPTLSDWLYLLLLGVICICVSMTIFQLGVMRTSANLAAVIISMSPVFTMLFARIFVGERFTKRKGVALVLNCIGLIIVANPLTLITGVSPDGILLVLAASVTFGLYTALGKKRIDKIGGVAQNSLSFLLGSFVQLVILVASGLPITSGITLSTVPVLLYLGIFVTGIGYFCYNKAIELSGPSTASITFFIKPVFAPILALLVLQEPLTINVILGVLFVLAGSTVNLTGKTSSGTDNAPAAVPAEELEP